MQGRQDCVAGTFSLLSRPTQSPKGSSSMLQCERAVVHAGQAGVRGGQFQAALLSLGALHLRSGHSSLALGALQVLSSYSPPLS